MKAAPRIWPVLVAAALGLVILLSLGVWQVKRLAWKEDLIARIEANAAAAPVDLATALRFGEEGRDIEFLKVRFPATYLAAPPLRMMATVGGGPGWTIIQPATTPDGFLVLVDRGQVPEQRLGEVATPAGQTELTGIIRRHDGGKGYFDPANDPAKGVWYWWDLPAMSAAAGAAPAARPYPFVVQLLPAPELAGFPRPPEPKVNLRNSHLGYAFTWFGLAAVLVVMTALYVRGQMKKSAA